MRWCFYNCNQGPVRARNAVNTERCTHQIQSDRGGCSGYFYERAFHPETRLLDGGREKSEMGISNNRKLPLPMTQRDKGPSCGSWPHGVWEGGLGATEGSASVACRSNPIQARGPGAWEVGCPPILGCLLSCCLCKQFFGARAAVGWEIDGHFSWFKHPEGLRTRPRQAVPLGRRLRLLFGWLHLYYLLQSLISTLHVEKLRVRGPRHLPPGHGTRGQQSSVSSRRNALTAQRTAQRACRWRSSLCPRVLLANPKGVCPRHLHSTPPGHTQKELPTGSPTGHHRTSSERSCAV